MTTFEKELRKLFDHGDFFRYKVCRKNLLRKNQ